MPAASARLRQAGQPLPVPGEAGRPPARPRGGGGSSAGKPPRATIWALLRLRDCSGSGRHPPSPAISQLGREPEGAGLSRPRSGPASAEAGAPACRGKHGPSPARQQVGACPAAAPLPLWPSAMSLGRGGREGPPLAPGGPEAECQICYEPFDGHARRPKLLSCRHRLCARCLRRMADVGESPGSLSCPFCRQETFLPDKDVGQLQDDAQLLASLRSGRERARRPALPPLSPEVLLCPGVLEPVGEGRHSSSDCLVITLLEMPEDLAVPEGVGLLDVMRLYRPPSLASLPCPTPLAKCPAGGACPALPRFLMGVLCLVYFSSLPLGIYLLLVERLSLGIVLVSLVPATLVLCIFYSLCQCLRHEIFPLPS